VKSPAEIDAELSEQIGECYADPLKFVLFAYPWGLPGELEHFVGPDRDQREFLLEVGEEVRRRKFNGRDAVPVLKYAISSGRGTGKSARAAWIVNWIMSTRPNAIGTVTANTNTQLQTKTWAAIRRWTNLSINSHWFEHTSEKLWHKDFPQTWFCTPQTCKEENAEAFAGQHSISSTSFYVFDEGSAVPDKIYDVALSGLVSGEPMFFTFGNPTRRTGQLFRACFGNERDTWLTRVIDSRNSELTNQRQLKEWVEEKGEDSDWVRVWVRGLPPSAGDFQFIDSERVYAAQRREGQYLPDDPLICGVDVARGGADHNVIRFRRGFDARTIPAQRIPGESTRDSMLLVSKLADLLADKRPERKISMMFVDSGYGGPVVNRLHQLGYKNVQEIGFGSASPDHHQANMRAYMWQQMKDWLLMGSIDKDERLEMDLTTPGYKHDKRDRLVLESKDEIKERGFSSPDDGDALALTFAQKVAPVGGLKKKRHHAVNRPWA
jgi:hypothetical protein